MRVIIDEMPKDVSAVSICEEEDAVWKPQVVKMLCYEQGGGVSRVSLSSPLTGPERVSVKVHCTDAAERASQL
ncbi:hypothetical protein JOQ06_008500 [Pogonophryne albipinna]|uniref:Uncharacterized protein n=1 Tax=Pogonophryne albipinna TaxID=1090488 RepID=A0AAD6AL95_9TELE|nr:hypothetical protein JOQ06_008500 [Pogonophryne albipinna]